MSGPAYTMAIRSLSMLLFIMKTQQELSRRLLIEDWLNKQRYIHATEFSCGRHDQTSPNSDSPCFSQGHLEAYMKWCSYIRWYHLTKVRQLETSFVSHMEWSHGSLLGNDPHSALRQCLEG